MSETIKVISGKRPIGRDFSNVKRKGFVVPEMVRAKMRKPVTLAKGDVVMTWPSTTEASKYIGVSDAAISHVKVGRSYSASGWHLPTKEQLENMGN